MKGKEEDISKIIYIYRTFNIWEIRVASVSHLRDNQTFAEHLRDSEAFMKHLKLCTLST